MYFSFFWTISSSFPVILFPKKLSIGTIYSPSIQNLHHACEKFFLDSTQWQEVIKPESFMSIPNNCVECEVFGIKYDGILFLEISWNHGRYLKPLERCIKRSKKIRFPRKPGIGTIYSPSIKNLHHTCAKLFLDSTQWQEVIKPERFMAIPNNRGECEEFGSINMVFFF